MVRSKCTNHPDKNIVDIEPGTRFCERCRHLVAPNWTPLPKPIPELVQEMALEEESEPIIETGLPALNTGILMRPDGAGTETSLEAENKKLKEELAEIVEARTLVEEIPEGFLEVKETPVEAEPEPSVEPATFTVTEETGTVTLTAYPEDSSKKAQIEALYAKLAELEK